MTKWDLLKTQAAPYLLYIKLALVAAVFASGMFVGCRWEKTGDETAINATAELNAENATLKSANAEYARLEKLRSDAAIQASNNNDPQRKELEAAAERAKQEAATLQKKLDAIEDRQRAARNNPRCVELMEMEVCPDLSQQ